MKVDKANSAYKEDYRAKEEFNATELRRARFLLRRLQFLETKIAEEGGMGSAQTGGGAAFAEWEVEALGWVLDEIGYLAEKNK